MCSGILLQAELLQWREDMAEPLALALGLVCDALMPDLSPPSTRGVLEVQGRALGPVGAGFVLTLCCCWAQPSPARQPIASGSGKSSEIWTLLGSPGSCQVPPALPARSAEGGSREKRAGLRRRSSRGLNFCLCHRRQRLCSGRGDSSPRPRGFSAEILRTPRAADLLVESILHWEGKATAVLQLAERAVCAQSRLPLPWHGAGLPWLPSLSPSPTSCCSVPATLRLSLPEDPSVPYSRSRAAGHKTLAMPVHPQPGEHRGERGRGRIFRVKLFSIS